MEERTRWFDRQFDLGLPADAFESVLERLRSAPGRLGQLVGDLTTEQVRRRIDDDWSIQENVGHLIDLEPLWDGRLDDFVAGREELRPADLENRRTHEAAHNERVLEDLLREFGTTRLAMVERMRARRDELLARTALHPRLRQPMTLTDLMFFIAEHDDHHLVTIAEIIRRVHSESHHGT
ncbi:MAG: DinB family protein [Gemmatimonadota bacterium]